MQSYIGDIVLNARKDTRNFDDIPSGSTTVGIRTDDFIRYGDWAQKRLQGLIEKKYPFSFLTSIEISLVADQSRYTILDNVFMGTKIRLVEYSVDGAAINYRRLKPGNPYSRINRTGGSPSEYNRIVGQIEILPTPTVSTGTLRVWYTRALDRVEARRATVASRTINGSNQITALTLTALSADDTTVLGALNTRYLCINDIDGTVLAYNIPIQGYNTGSGVCTIAAHTLGAAETVPVGAYVTIGKYTTTHSKLPEDCERYLTEYINRRIFKRGPSKDANSISQELRDIEDDIVASYKVGDNDVRGIPIVDYEIMLLDSWE